MDKKTLLAIVLALMVLGFYPLLLEKFYPQSKMPQRVEAPAAVPGAAPAEAVPAELSASAFPSADLSESDDRAFENGRLKLVFNAKGGLIREAYFLKYLNSVTDQPLRFLSLQAPTGAPGELEWVGSKAQLGTYEIKETDYDTITATADGPELRVTKTFRFPRDGYAGTLSVLIENKSGAPRDLRYRLYAASSIPRQQSIDAQYIEANFYSRFGDKTKLRHIKQTKLGKQVTSQTPLEWIALKDRHFSVILKPESQLPFTGIVRGLGQNNSNAALVSPSFTVASGGSVRHDFVLYIGPSDLQNLQPLGLDPIISFGKLDGIAKILVGGLELLHKIFRNYGIAIIVLTMLINIMLFPLTRVSYMSMKRMQLIQPQINKLREQYKKTPEKLNKEMMELYKKHKVNPFGGCLPMVLQMPVFISLYVALSKSVVLRNSNLLWIKDLSSPDNIALPFSLPLFGDHVHVLPLVMVVAMVCQQKLTQIKTDGQDPSTAMQQKMMSTMMPIVFGFIFYSMPSGLVLYWLTNTILMTLYQWRLKKITLT